jgi:hypothetical protein
MLKKRSTCSCGCLSQILLSVCIRLAGLGEVRVDRLAELLLHCRLTCRGQQSRRQGVATFLLLTSNQACVGVVLFPDLFPGSCCTFTEQF